MEDKVNHPKHYAGVPAMIECIDITRHLPFALGNAVKYIWRAGKKGGPEQEIEDLEKAQWYLDEELEHMTASDLGTAQAVFSTITPGSMDRLRHEAIGYILSGECEEAGDVIEEWICKAQNRRAKK